MSNVQPWNLPQRSPLVGTERLHVQTDTDDYYSTPSAIASLAGPLAQRPLSTNSGSTRYGNLPGWFFTTWDWDSSLGTSTKFWYTPIEVHAPIQIDAIGVYVSGQGVGAGGRLGIVTANNYWIPDALHLGGALGDTYDGSSQGLKWVTLGTQTLARGRYHITLQPNGTAHTVRSARGGPIGMLELGMWFNNTVIQFESSTAPAYGAFPSTAPSVNINSSGGGIRASAFLRIV